LISVNSAQELRGLDEILSGSSGRQRDGEETKKDARLRVERVNVADLVIELLLNGSSTSVSEGNDCCATARGRRLVSQRSTAAITCRGQR
jgi:hypothetical protein